MRSCPRPSRERAYTAPVTVLGETRDALGGGVLVIRDAARLLVRHFPALLTVFLFGLAAHNGVLWAAVLIGRDHVVIASLLVPLAPLSMAIAIVVMIRIAGGDLITTPETGSLGRRITLFTSTLVPFLAVYALSGKLTEDRETFINESYADDFYNIGTSFTDGGLADRSLATVDGWMIGITVVFFAIRLLIDVLDLEEKHPVWALVQVLVEVTWLTWLTIYISNRWVDAKDWLKNREVFDELGEGWTSATSTLGPLAEPLRGVGRFVSEAFTEINGIVVTPIAWLVVGAVILVGGLPASRRAELQLPRSARGMDDRISGLRRLSTRRGPAKALELATRRFDDLVTAFRVLRQAGVLPVLAFCLVFPLARLAEWGTAEVLRLAIGPQEPLTMTFFSTYPSIVTTAAFSLVVVVIVVAALERLLLRPDTATAAADQRSTRSIST